MPLPAIPAPRAIQGRSAITSTLSESHAYAGLGSRGPARLIAALGEPSSSRFRGEFPTQKSREAVGHGYCDKGSFMTHVGCSNCRVRFSAAAAAYLVACPECGQAPQQIPGAEGVVGFRLFGVEDLPQELPEAVAVAIPIQDPGEGRS
jgi:hypothetical protein